MESDPLDTAERFEGYAQNALDSLPLELRARMSNLEIVVEDEPLRRRPLSGSTSPRSSRSTRRTFATPDGAARVNAAEKTGSSQLLAHRRMVGNGASLGQDVAVPNGTDQGERIFCNRCGRNTWHDRKAGHQQAFRPEDYAEMMIDFAEADWEVWQCRGCEDVTFKETWMTSEDIESLRPLRDTQRVSAYSRIRACWKKRKILLTLDKPQCECAYANA